MPVISPLMTSPITNFLDPNIFMKSSGLFSSTDKSDRTKLLFTFIASLSPTLNSADFWIDLNLGYLLKLIIVA